jgi:glycerophosphoryl diester phosphodiesterase
MLMSDNLVESNAYKGHNLAMPMFLKILLQLIVDYSFGLIPRFRPKQSDLENAKIVLHRGWHNNKDVMENSLKAFELALEHKFWGIEFDIRWTKDLVPVVHHDPTTKRVWKKDILISDCTFNQLRQEVPEIPTFKEVVSLAGGKTHLFIEIKEENYPMPQVQREKLETILSDLKPVDDFHLIGLSLEHLKVFNKSYDKKVNLMVAQTNTDEMSECSLDQDYAGVMGHYLLVDNEMISRHKKVGQKIGTGFCRNKNVLYREINRGVDWIFTNHPWNLL